MSNSQLLNNDKDTILWLDQNVYNEENKNTYEKYLPKFKDFNFFCFTSVDKLIKYIGNNLNYFEFRHFYVIVSGRLAENFFNSYLIIAEKYNVIADTIVYCYNQKYHETKPYFMDKFLNPGGITIDFENVVNYILKDECDWKNNEKNYQEYIPEKKGFGDVFINIDTSNEYELALPILITRTINCSLIEKDEITNFQNLLISRYCKSYSKPIMKLIKPSGNKKMNIPLHFLAKFFIKFYTQEKKSKNEGQNFYADMNKDLTNDKFDDYHPFIFLIYDCLNKKYLQSYRKKLYRGGQLSKIEFDKMVSNFNKNNNKKIFYYSKNFLSFSKDINVAYNFIKNNGQKTDDNTVNILFILDECKDENFFVTNIDIELLSSIKSEKEVLNLPLTCFEIVKIGEEETYGKVKYRKLYLNYLDKYQEKINDKINDLWENNNTKEIDNFLDKSIKSQFGKSVEKCYKKKEKLFVNYAKILKASPYNSYFLSKITKNLMLNTKTYSNSKKQTAAHVDDEIGNLINEYKCKDSEDKDTCILQNKITNFIDKKLSQLKINIENIENSCSIGYCLGNFLSNYDNFRNAPNSVKCFSLASLALACGPHIVKIIPQLKQILEKEVINSLNIEMILDGLNILWAVSVELYCLFEFHREYYNKNWNLTKKYIGKNLINFGIAWGSSIIGNLAVKACIYGFYMISGISLAPYVTAVGIIGIVVGGIFGYLGNNVGNYLAEKALGKDEFKLTSANLYYLYIPEKYRKPGNNPHLQWNKIGLTDEVKSYIIECIVNDVETRMRVINIPKNVIELPGCLGYNHDNSQITDDEDTDFSSDEEVKEKKRKIYLNKKCIGDLVIPYKGIKNNAFKVDFIIYRIKKRKISVKDWINFRDRNSKLNLIHDCFIYSIY